jgi:hypothetical protein
MMHVRIVRRYQRGNQSPLIEEEQIREWSKETGQSTHNDLQNITQKTKDRATRISRICDLWIKCVLHIFLWT